MKYKSILTILSIFIWSCHPKVSELKIGRLIEHNEYVLEAPILRSGYADTGYWIALRGDSHQVWPTKIKVNILCDGKIKIISKNIHKSDVIDHGDHSEVTFDSTNQFRCKDGSQIKIVIEECDSSGDINLFLGWLDR